MKSGKKIKIRKRWVINPKSRIRESEKVYSRKKARRELRKETRGNLT